VASSPSELSMRACAAPAWFGCYSADHRTAREPGRAIVTPVDERSKTERRGGYPNHAPGVVLGCLRSSCWSPSPSADARLLLHEQNRPRVTRGRLLI
jgi:hypothetical protein